MLARLIPDHRTGTRRRLSVLSSVVVGIAVGASVLSGCGERATESGGEGGTKKVDVQLAWLPNVQSAGEYVAQAKGFYKDQGLDVTLKPGGPNANPVQLIASGKSDIGVTYAPSLMLARNQGIPVKSFGATMQKAPLAYFSLAKENITSVKDFAGKKIGIQVGGEPLLESMLKKNGLKKSDVDIVTVGSDTTPAVTGQVDVIASWEINLEQLKPLAAAGKLNKQLLFDNGTKFQSNYYIATDKTLGGDPDELASFLKGSALGWKYAFAHPEEAVDIVMKANPGLERTYQLKQLKDYLPDYVEGEAVKAHGFGWMDEEMWAGAIADYKSFGLIKDGVSVKDVSTMSVLEAADLKNLK